MINFRRVRTLRADVVPLFDNWASDIEEMLRARIIFHDGQFVIPARPTVGLCKRELAPACFVFAPVEDGGQRWPPLCRPR